MKKPHQQIHHLHSLVAAFAIIALCTQFCGQHIEAAVKKPAKPPAPSITVSDTGEFFASLPKKTTDKVDGFTVYISKESDVKSKDSIGSWYSSDDLSDGKESITDLWTDEYAPGKYYVRARTWNYTKSYNYKHSDYSDATPINISWNLTVNTVSTSKVKLVLDSASGPVGTIVEGQRPQEYEIYRSNSANDGFTLLDTIDGSYFDDYTDKSVSLGNTYYYKVKANFYDEDSYWINLFDYDNDYEYDYDYDYNEPVIETPQPKPSPIYTLETNVAKGHPGPVSTNKLKSKPLKNNKLKLSWKAVSDVDGYYLYYVNSMGKRTKITKTSSTSYTWKKRKHGTEYTILVVPYMTYSDKEITGANDKTFTAVMNYYTNHYDDKAARIWGAKQGYKMFVKYENKRHQGKPFYPSAKKASKHMTSFKIKVWDFKSGKSGKKITRTFYLTVNKKVAPSLKKAFNEIYKGKEKFPIHSIGGYSYRKGQHGVGLAVDINPNENAMFQNGKAVVGSHYRPGKDPYSIPRNGEVAKILNKYGFSQLNNDFMHFSYFGT